MLNLNKKSEYIFLSQVEFGKTNNIELKINKTVYMLDIDKNSDSSSISFYKRIDKERWKYSKYDAVAELSNVRISNDAILDKRFFENIKEIEKAQNIYRDFPYLK